MKTGIELIAEERAAQVSREGWTPEHDDEHASGELSCAAACYISLVASQLGEGCDSDGDSAAVVPDGWPWDDEWWKPKDDPMRNLVRAGALIAAEIDRLQRAAVLAHGSDEEKK